MASQPVGQRLQYFMDARGFDLEDLLGLSFIEFRIFLGDPEFGVDNVQILFLLRDWRNAKANLSSFPLVSIRSSFGGEEIEMVSVTMQELRSGLSSAEEENSLSTFISDLEAISNDDLRPKFVACRRTRSSATEIGRLQRRVRGFGDATSYRETTLETLTDLIRTESDTKIRARETPRLGHESWHAAAWLEL
jgi:hypothetical protein